MDCSLPKNHPLYRRGQLIGGLVVTQPVMEKLAGCLTDGLKAGAVSHDRA